jgi:threonine synthase
MNYVSTRGQAAPIGFMDALFVGLASDGGLYVPEAWPTLTAAEIAGFKGRPYAKVAADILCRFVGDSISPDAVRRICKDAYATFDHAQVAPLTPLDNGRTLLELFHGPTLAFKDVAMQVLARLYEHGLRAGGRDLTIVCATSGDTGGAAVEAFAGRDHIRVVALYPEGRISEVQRRFMTTSGHANVRAVAVAGDFDDCQALLKGLFRDEGFVGEIGLSLVNSINIARVIAQIVYYFTAAVALGAPEQAVSFAVPTGNFGDAYAGWAARRMGLPIRRIVVATNVNDIVARALETGVYRRGVAVATQSPSMDIQVASNFERLVYDCLDGDAEATATAFAGFAQSGEIVLAPGALSRMREVFRAAAIDEAETDAAMARAMAVCGVTIDPHTAVAVAGAECHEAEAGTPTIVLATAHPAKFPDAVRVATGFFPDRPTAVAERAERAERIDRLPADEAALKRYLRAFAETAH